ncbi:hypothetical protein FOZ63_024260, partial [Perkinsus olseni]
TDDEVEHILREVCQGVVRKGRQFAEAVGMQHETRRLEQRANKSRRKQQQQQQGDDVTAAAAAAADDDDDDTSITITGVGPGSAIDVQTRRLSTYNDGIHRVLLEAADRYPMLEETWSELIDWSMQ